MSYNVHFLHVVRYPEALVKSYNVCWVWSGTPGHAQRSPTFSKKAYCKYLSESLSYFVYLLRVVTYTGKLQCSHVVLVGYGSTLSS